MKGLRKIQPLYQFRKSLNGTLKLNGTTITSATCGECPKMLRQTCAIYCRVSTDEQNCDRQEFELLAFAERMDYEVVGIYKEVASGAKDNRQIRRQVIDLANKGTIQAVLVSELTRWGRSTQDLIETVNQLFNRKVSLICLNGQQFNLNDPMGNFMLRLFASLSEYERDLLTERIRSGMNEARRKGKRFGRPEGYNKYSKYQQRILTLRAEKKSIREIAGELKLSPTTVQKVLKLST